MSAVTPGYKEHASPEAIRSRMGELRRKQRGIQRELFQLEALFILRVEEKLSGKWPYSTSSGSAATEKDPSAGGLLDTPQEAQQQAEAGDE